MSGISSSIGLVTGIDSKALIDQLIAFESRPIASLQSRVQDIDQRRAAFLELSAQLLAIRNSVSNFDKPSFFNRFTATSTNEDVVSATATENALPSSTTFRVRSLVASHSFISRGFADTNRTPVGAGAITIEVGAGRVNDGTNLDTLNGGSGVGRGTIRITDRSGASAEIDLTTAQTVDDILRAINSETGINVRARVTGIPTFDFSGNQVLGDRIVIDDLTNGSGNLIIVDINGGRTAADLGIAADVAAGRIDGKDLVRLTETTQASLLNDGNGIGGVGGVIAKNDLTFTSTTEGSFEVSLSSFMDNPTDLRALNSGAGVRFGVIRITDRAGNSVDVDLSDLESQAVVTVGDIKARINNATQQAGVAVTIGSSASSGSNGDSNIFLVTDESTPDPGQAGSLKIEDLSGFSAADLGIANETDNASYGGRNVYSVSTLGDVIRAINFAPNNSFVHATISDDGNGIELTAQGFGNEVTVTAAVDPDGNTNSTAARDLGLLGATFSSSGGSFRSRPLVAGLNTVLLQTLNGGQGTTAGVISITDRTGATATIDLSTARTLQDVIDLVNADGTTALTASVNRGGTGLQLTDGSNGAGSIVINDVSGTLAEDLGLAGTHLPDVGSVVDGGNAQRQYITENTLLSDLNLGRGVSSGSIQITTADGAVRTIDLSSATTVGAVIDRLNRTDISARINDTGDGILITDATSGDGLLTIEDVDGGSTASDLRLVNTARTGGNTIDGSFETRIEISANDTLADVARKISDAGAGVSTSVINDGSTVAPFSLSLTSETAGRRGELTIDTGGIDLGLQTLSRAQDAVVTIGDAEGGIRLITSSSNTLDNVVEGVTFDLLSTSNEEITINVAQDIDAIVEGVQQFVDQYNSTLDKIAEGDTFNSETFKRGPLFGDSTVDQIQSRLRRAILGQAQGVDAAFSRPFSVGLRLGSGGKLEFNEETFRDAYERAPEKVQDLFTHKDTGFGATIQDALDGMTENLDGLLARKDTLLGDQQSLLTDRIDQLNVLIQAKRARLEAQFVALESAIAGLQNQQTSLATLQNQLG